MATQLPTITPRYLLETRRYLMLAVVIGLVGVLLLVLGLIPQVQTILDLQSKNLDQQDKVASLEQKVQQLDQVLSPELLEQIQTVNVLLPSKKPLLELLTTLNTIAAQTQVSYSGIELSPGSIATESAGTGNTGPSRRAGTGSGGASGADTLEVELRVQGTLEQLNAFFRAVESSAPISTIVDLSLSPRGRSALLSNEVSEVTSDLYEADVTIAAAYFTQSVSAAVNAALPTLTQDQQAFLDELASFTVQELAPQQEVTGGGLDDLFGVAEPPTGVRN